MRQTGRTAQESAVMRCFRIADRAQGTRYLRAK